MTAEASRADPVVSLDDRPQPRQEVAAVELDGAVVLLDDRGQVHVLNSTAGLVWACFDGHGRLGEIADDIAEAYSIAPDDVRLEVVALTEDLVARGLLHLPGNDAVSPRPDPGPTLDQAVIVPPGRY